MSRKSKQAPDPARVPAARPGRAGGKRDVNRKRRTAELCEAALPLFLDHGIPDVTIDQIVERAGVAKGSFYRYFQDKAELVATIMGPLAERFSEAMNRCEQSLLAARQAEELTPIYARLAAELGVAIVAQRGAMLLYLQEARAPGIEARRAIRDMADMVLEKAVAVSRAPHHHGIMRGSNWQVDARVVLGAAERLIFGYLSGEELPPPDEAVPNLIALVLDGVRGRQGTTI